MKESLHEILAEIQKQCLQLNVKPILLYPVLQNGNYLTQDEIDLIKSLPTTTQMHSLIFILLKAKPDEILLALQEIFYSQQLIDLFKTIREKLEEIGCNDLIWDPVKRLTGAQKMKDDFHNVLDKLQKRCIELKYNPVWLYPELQNANYFTQDEIDLIKNQTTTTEKHLAIFNTLKGKSEVVILDLQKAIHSHNADLVKEIHVMLREFDKEYLILQNIVSINNAAKSEIEPYVENATNKVSYEIPVTRNAQHKDNERVLTGRRDWLADSIAWKKEKESQDTRLAEILKSNKIRQLEIEEAVNIQMAKEISVLKMKAATEGKEVDVQEIAAMTARVQNSRSVAESGGGPASAVIRRMQAIWNKNS